MLIKILVVDDSASDRLIITNMLKDFAIQTAKDGSEAIRMLREDADIQLMILDLNMPVMDGFQVLEMLKTEDKLNKIRTIILTNYDELDNEIRGLRLGAVDYIRKPIHMESLRARIEVHAALLQARHWLEQQLAKQELAFDVVFSQVPVGIAISFNQEGTSPDLNKYFSINPALEEITGRTKDELMKTGWASITHPDDLIQDVASYSQFQAGQIDSYEMDKRFIRPDGSIVWVHMIVSKMALDDSHRFNHIALFKDITESKKFEQQLMESERSKAVLLSHLPGMAYRCRFDRNWTMEYVSAGCLALTGYPPQELIDNKGLSFNELIPPEFQEYKWKEINRALADHQSLHLEYEITTASGDRKWVIEMGQGIFDDEGEVLAIEGIIIDITDRKKVENTLKFNSEHDGLTGLHNRRYLENLLANELQNGKMGKRALISINLSSILKLTTANGFHYTQNIIKNISQVLATFCSNGCQLFKTFENRFVFYVTRHSDLPDLIAYCKKVAETLENFFSVERIGGGIGILQFDHTTKLDADQLLKNILVASEKAIEPNDSEFRICVYDQEFEQQVDRRKKLEAELDQIAHDPQDGGLSLQFQPILDLRTQRICGFEALARMESRELGKVPPLEFIPLAEKTKLIIPIGNKVFRRALRFLGTLRTCGYTDVSISVNVSVIQLLEHGFCDSLLALLQEMQAIPEQVGIEITESVFASDFEEVNDILANLRREGIHISIDDFGTGYSSLARESELHVDCLKIDKYFIDKITSVDVKKVIVGDIISMAHRYDHCTVAEGVEYEQQLQYLKANGCDKIQGYLISRPLDEQKAIEFLNGRSIGSSG